MVELNLMKNGNEYTESIDPDQIQGFTLTCPGYPRRKFAFTREKAVMLFEIDQDDSKNHYDPSLFEEKSYELTADQFHIFVDSLFRNILTKKTGIAFTPSGAEMIPDELKENRELARFFPDVNNLRLRCNDGSILAYSYDLSKATPELEEYCRSIDTDISLSDIYQNLMSLPISCERQQENSEMLSLINVQTGNAFSSPGSISLYRIFDDDMGKGAHNKPIDLFDFMRLFRIFFMKRDDWSLVNFGLDNIYVNLQKVEPYTQYPLRPGDYIETDFSVFLFLSTQEISFCRDHKDEFPHIDPQKLFFHRAVTEQNVFLAAMEDNRAPYFRISHPCLVQNGETLLDPRKLIGPYKRRVDLLMQQPDGTLSCPDPNGSGKPAALILTHRYENGSFECEIVSLLLSNDSCLVSMDTIKKTVLKPFWKYRLQPGDVLIINDGLTTFANQNDHSEASIRVNTLQDLQSNSLLPLRDIPQLIILSQGSCFVVPATTNIGESHIVGAINPGVNGRWGIERWDRWPVSVNGVSLTQGEGRTLHENDVITAVGKKFNVCFLPEAEQPVNEKKMFSDVYSPLLDESINRKPQNQNEVRKSYPAVRFTDSKMSYIKQCSSSKTWESELIWPGIANESRISKYVNAALSKPTISVDAYFEEEDEQYLAFPYVPGKTLQEIMSFHTFSEEEIWEFARILLKALSEIDRMGFRIVHNDLRPANILFDHSGQLKLIGFETSFVSQWGEMIYSLGGRYDAPEKIAGLVELPPSRTSDLFSAGAILFEMACGRPINPMANYSEDWYAEKLKEYAEGTLYPSIPACSDQLNHLIRSLTQIHPDFRPKSAFEAIRLLDQLLSPNTETAESAAGNRLGKIWKKNS